MSAFGDWQPEFAAHNIPTFPVRDKRPAVRGWQRIGLRGSEKLAERHSTADQFGFCVERAGITVVDVDSPKDTELVDAIGKFGATDIIVRSGSGHHQLWYRSNGEGRQIRPDPSRPIDVLGTGYVVAPPSAGKNSRYRFVTGDLSDLRNLRPMLPMIAPPQPSKVNRADVIAGAIPVGRRNDSLWRDCMIAARTCQNFDSLLSHAAKLNLSHMTLPLSDAEVTQIAASAWQKQVAGENWIGERRVIATHDEIDGLMMQSPDAFILLQMLRRHHHPSHEFVIGNAMAGIMPSGGWTRKRLAAARTALTEAGSIEITRTHSKIKGPAIFRFK